MNVLVTGGAGYIGSHTVVELIKAGHTPIIVDDLSNAKADVVDRIETITGKRPAFFQLDCKDKEGLRSVFAAHRLMQSSILPHSRPWVRALESPWSTTATIWTAPSLCWK